MLLWMSMEKPLATKQFIRRASMESNKYELNLEDFRRIGLNILTFNVPVFLLAILVGLQQKADMQEVILMASVTLLTAMIDTIKKLVEGKAK